MRVRYSCLQRGRILAWAERRVVVQSRDGAESTLRSGGRLTAALVEYLYY